MSIGFYDFASLHHHEFREKVLHRFKDIVDKNAFIEGEYNASFERRFADLQHAKHCLLVANGTDALEIALQAYDIGPGDNVGIAAISFYATAECVLNIGATPVFIDVDDHGLMSAESLQRVLKEHQLKAIIPVHIYGLPAPIEELEKICQQNNIKIVEDGAQSQGGNYQNGQPIGSSHHLITYSFYPTKNLGAFGDAGAILTQSDELKDKIVKIRNHGRSPDGHILIGRNSRCDHLQAAVLDLKLDAIEEQNQQRKQVAKWYHQELKGTPLKIVDDQYLETSSWHLYPVQAKNKDEKYKLWNFLKERSIGSALFYEKSLPEEVPLLEYFGEKNQAIEFAGKTLCIPMNPFVTQDHVVEVANTIKEFYGQ